MVLSAERKSASQKHDRAMEGGTNEQTQMKTRTNLPDSLNPLQWAGLMAHAWNFSTWEPRTMDAEFKVSLGIANYSEQAPVPQTKPCVYHNSCCVLMVLLYGLCCSGRLQAPGQAWSSSYPPNFCSRGDGRAACSTQPDRELLNYHTVAGGCLEFSRILSLWQFSCLSFAKPGITDVSHHTHLGKLSLTDWFCTLCMLLPENLSHCWSFGSVLLTLPFLYETFFFHSKGIKYLLNAWCSFFENLEKT